MDKPAPPSDRDAGFSLIEVIVSIGMITVVMGALTTLFVTSIQTTSKERARQAAVQLVTQEADHLRGLTPQQVQDATQPVAKTSNDTTYQLSWTTDHCFRLLEGSGEGDCVDAAEKASGATYVTFRRVTVVATWHAQGCTESGCTYDDSIMLNDDKDPVFPLNKKPPAPPTLRGCKDQVVTVGQEFNTDVRDDQLGCHVEDGVGPFTWTIGGLPQGLTLSTDGRITGTVTALAGTTTSSTLTVTDAFLRNDHDAFTWTVIKPLTEFHVRSLWLRIGHEKPISIDLNDFLNPGTTGVTYSLISGSLPKGLTLNEPAPGIISGTHEETEAKNYKITIRATDPAGNNIESTFMWYVRGNDPNKLLLCPTGALPYDPAIPGMATAPQCTIPGYYDEGHSYGSDTAEFKVDQPIPPFDLWDDTYGGTSPYRFTTDGRAPSWLHIDAKTGVVSGTPRTVTGDQPLKFQFQVYDADDDFYANITVRWRVIE